MIAVSSSGIYSLSFLNLCEWNKFNFDLPLKFSKKIFGNLHFIITAVHDTLDSSLYNSFRACKAWRQGHIYSASVGFCAARLYHSVLFGVNAEAFIEPST